MRLPELAAEWHLVELGEERGGCGARRLRPARLVHRDLRLDKEVVADREVAAAVGGEGAQHAVEDIAVHGDAALEVVNVDGRPDA